MKMRSSRNVARSYDHVWRRSDDEIAERQPWHYARLAKLIGEPLSGRVLDAGCGSGRDPAELARRGCDVIAIDLSEAAVEVACVRRAAPRSTSSAPTSKRCRCATRSSTRCGASACCITCPLRHRGCGAHPGPPTRGRLVIYVYEDLAERSALERGLLRIVSAVRALTTRAPGPVLYRVCQALSLPTFLTFTLTARTLRRWRATEPLARWIPFRYGTGPFALAGDIYDRFATPIERRYGRRDVERWLSGEGLGDVVVRYADGWVASARRPAV